jgi:hypothetical protein
LMKTVDNVDDNGFCDRPFPFAIAHPATPR